MYNVLLQIARQVIYNVNSIKCQCSLTEVRRIIYDRLCILPAAYVNNVTAHHVVRTACALSHAKFDPFVPIHYLPHEYMYTVVLTRALKYPVLHPSH